MPSRGSVEPGIAAAYREAIARRGQSISIQRVSGNAPNVTTITATVPAVIQSYSPAGDAAAKMGLPDPVDATAEGTRQVLLMEQDLIDQGFPLPIRKNDKAFVVAGQRLNVETVDDVTRRLGGSIDLTVSGFA